MIGFHVTKSETGRWYYVADNTGLRWSREFATHAEADRALSSLRAVAHR
jgi:hypothetical protein